MSQRVEWRGSRIEGQKWNRDAAVSAQATGRFAADSPAFTLVELMVVVALIALLTALLLPSLSQSRHFARRIKCASNLRQLGLAAQMYWDDNAGQCFRYRVQATNSGDVFWFGWLQRGSEGNRSFDPKAGALFPYLAGRGVEICPALIYALQEFKLKASGAAYGYGYNLYLSAPLEQPPINVARIARPSETALLADAAQVNTFQAPASPEHPMLEEFYYVNANEATAHFRHQQRANTVFGDGHVERQRAAPGSFDQRLPRHHVGRLRAEMLMLP